MRCVEIDAALRNPLGAGSRRLHSLAVETLGRTKVGPWCDPRAIVLGIGRVLRLVTRAEHRAELEGPRVTYLWHPDRREAGLSVFIGAALATLADEGLPALPADVTALAGYLALPEHGLPLEIETGLQVHAPIWFLEAHQRRRRWGDSGTYAAIRG